MSMNIGGVDPLKNLKAAKIEPQKTEEVKPEVAKAAEKKQLPPDAVLDYLSKSAPMSEKEVVVVYVTQTMTLHIRESRPSGR